MAKNTWAKILRRLFRPRRRYTRGTPELAEIVQQLRARGLSLAQIARELAISEKLATKLAKMQLPQPEKENPADELRELLTRYRELRDLVSEISRLEGDRPALERFLDTLAQTLGQGLSAALPNIIAQAAQPVQAAPPTSPTVPPPAPVPPVTAPASPGFAPPGALSGPPAPGPHAVQVPVAAPTSADGAVEPPRNLRELRDRFAASTPAEAAEFIRRLAATYQEWAGSLQLLRSLSEEQVDQYIAIVARTPDGGAELAAFLRSNPSWTRAFLEAVKG